ncbi:MAG TPA: hypothetical protein VFZ86_10445 [Thermoleophilia bacterium]|nr:hypothetical protein [Thermoleophilia bacterium]
MSYLATFVIGLVLTGAWLWAVARWAGFVVPTADLLIIVGLCSGLAVLPGAGWILAMLFLTLLVVKLTEADPWPDVVLVVTGSGVVWVVAGITRALLAS